MSGLGLRSLCGYPVSYVLRSSVSAAAVPVAELVAIGRLVQAGVTSQIIETALLNLHKIDLYSSMRNV